MRTKSIACSLLLTACCFTACSSGTNEREKDETENQIQSPDTSLRGHTGTLEKNPPVQEGDYIVKYPNGIVKLKGYYLHGKREGQWTSFFETGTVQSEGFFKTGLRHGKTVVYYQNGKIYYVGNYKDGKEVDKWVFYDEQGNKVKEKDYGKPKS